jgi:hypothetical protein
MPERWLEVSLHLEGPTIGEFEQGFRGFLWFHVALYALHAALPMTALRLLPDMSSYSRIKIS